MERMEQDKAEREAKKRFTKSFLNPEAFRKQAHPRVGRSPRERAPEGMDVGSALYEKGFQREHRKRLREEMEKEEVARLANSKKSTYTSDRIMDGLLHRTFQDLFNLLDSDRDGQISSSRIDISQVPSRTLKIIAPLLIEMEDAEVVLNAETFEMAGRKLLKVKIILRRLCLRQKSIICLG